MATKSDFAQKLLHDLKLRKQQIAASNHSHSTTRDAYRSPAQASRQNKALASVGTKSMNQQTRPSSSRSLDIKESTQQIVSYERNGSSDYIGDLSVAFAYALQNGGKAGKLDFSSQNSSMIDFLHQIGRRSLDTGKMDRTGSINTHRSSTGPSPTISNIHIKEISKGVQNLNQILRACSNGIKFDKHSLEVGKELLKGAKGLEESLRMLVNLQEASEYMVSPQRKNRNRIILLDEDEEDEDNDEMKIAEQRQLDLPRFSFDKRSRNSHGTNEAANQRPMTISYSTDPPSRVSHKRSASCGPELRTLSTLSDTTNSASSAPLKSEKGRISNVIAKLMGLEDIPEKKEGTVGRSLNTSIKNAEISKGEVEKLGTLASNDGVPVQQAIKILKIQDIAVSLKAKKIKMPSSANGGVPDEKTNRNVYETGLLSSNKGRTSIDKRQSLTRRSNQIPGNSLNGQDNERGHAKHKEPKSKEEGPNMEVKQNHRSPLITDTLPEKFDGKKSKLQPEKIDEARLISQKDQGLLQQQMPLKFGQQVKNHGTEKSNPQMSKQELPPRKQDRSHIRSKVSSNSTHAATSIRNKQSHGNQGTPTKRSAAVINDEMPLKELPDNKENEDFSRDDSSIKSFEDASPNKNESQMELELNQEKKPDSEQQLRPEKPVHIPPIQRKEDSMYKREAPRKMDEVMSRRNGALGKLTRPLKHQRSIMQELKQRKQEKMCSLEGVEHLNSKRSKGQEMVIESELNIQPQNEEKPIQEKDEWASIITQNTGGDECQSPKVVPSPTFVDSNQSTTSEVLSHSNDQKGQPPDCKEDVEMMFQDSSPNPVTGADEGKMKNHHAPLEKHKKAPILRTHLVLTENEKHLKEILIQGHSFLNAAEALFKLNIPVGNLYEENHNHRQGWEAKLKLDCGIELMRRKARSEELSVHQYMKTYVISYKKIRSLDELVKELYKDFQSLMYDGRKEVGDQELDAADCLHKMLERDIQRKNDQDINSVWDFGWNEMMFAFVEKEDVTRDLEKYLLNELIDEMAQDLLSMNLSF